MVGKCGDNGEDAERLQLRAPLVRLLVVALADEVEERVVVVVEVVNTDLKDALPVVFIVRLDELHPNVEMVERLHAEVVLLAVVLDGVKIVPGILSLWYGEPEVVVKVLGSVNGGGQGDGVTGGEDPRQREVDLFGRTVHQHDGDVVAAVVAGEEGLAEVQLVELLLARNSTP